MPAQRGGNWKLRCTVIITWATAAGWGTTCNIGSGIGRSAPQRARHLEGIVNNTRFVLFPWVRVPHLASHILSQISRRLRQDWQTKYGQSLWLVETFVERQRFAGTCYRAANWIGLGQTRGRGRQGPAGRLSTTIKDVYVWPLHRDFRRYLNPLEIQTS